MREGNLLVTSITPKGKREFFATVVRVVNGEKGNPQHLFLTVKGNKVVDQFKKPYPRELFESALKS